MEQVRSWRGFVIAGAAIVAFGGAVLGAALVGSEGSREVRIGTEAAILEQLRHGGSPLHVPELDLFLVLVDDDGVSFAGRTDLQEQADLGVIALAGDEFGRPGESLIWCDEANGFISDLSASTFDRYGRRSGGPAPTGVAQRRVFARSGALFVDLSTPLPGPSLQGDHEPAGPFARCPSTPPGDAAAWAVP